MKKLIHKYLDKNYGWEFDALIFLQPKEFTNFRILIKDLNTVFSLTKKQTKWYIKSWVKKTNSRVNFNKLWNDSIHIYPIRVTWTPEMAEDISAHTGLHVDVQAELVRLLSEQMAEEIDRKILNRMLNLTNEEINP